MFKPNDPRNILYSRPHEFIVFISSKMANGALEKERRVAIETVNAFRPALAWAWETSAPAGSYYSEEECVRRAGTSDALILILDDELTPVTRKEFEAARQGPANLIILTRRGATRDRALQDLIDGARHEAITKDFSDLAELESEIDAALWEWFVRGGRTLGLQVQERRQSEPDLSLLSQAELSGGEWGTVTVETALEKAREEIAAGSSEEVLWEIYGWAATAVDEDHYPLARLLIDKLEEIVPAEAIDEVARGWILNLEGRIVSGKGDPDAARYFEQMRLIGVATNEKELIATALQNLGVQAVIAADHRLAGERFKEAFELKTETKDDYGAVQIMLNFVNVLIGSGSFEAARQILADLAPHLNDSEARQLRASVHGQLGLIFSKEGRFEDARQEFKRSLADARSAGSGSRQITALQNLGANALERLKPREAIGWFKKGFAIAEALDDHVRMATLAAAEGDSLAKLERWEEAARCFALAARMATLSGNLSSEAQAWANVGACWRELGRPEEALKLIDQALSNPNADQSPDWRARQLRNLAEVLEDLGRSTEALNRLEEAARLAKDAELIDAALQRAAEIALIHPGLSERADGYLKRALDLQREIGSSTDAAWRAAQMGALLSSSSQASAAPEYFTIALRVFARNGERRRAFHVRNDRGIALGSIGSQKPAVKDLKAALKIAREIGDLRLEFQAELNLGELERRREHYVEARAHELRAIEIARAIPDPASEGSALNTIGLIETDLGNFEAAKDSYGEALQIARNSRDEQAQAEALGGLAGVAFRQEQFAEAARRFEQAVRRQRGQNTVSLVEDLGGLVVSRAARGKLIEEELQELIDMSGRLGWDVHCAREMAEAARLLYAAGEKENAVSMQAVAVTCALRASFTAAEPDYEERFEVLVEVLLKGRHWMRVDSNVTQMTDALITETSEALSIEATELDFIRNLLDTAETEIKATERKHAAAAETGTGPT